MIGFPIFRFISFPIALFVPGYHSLMAVMSDGTDDDTQWLCYWLIVAIFFFLEQVFNLIFCSIPFYYEIKCGLLLYLQWGDAHHSFQAFEKYIEPILSSVEPKIDEWLEKYSQTAQDIQSKVMDVGQKVAIKAAIENASK